MPALRAPGGQLQGEAFIGPEAPAVEAPICRMGGTGRLGRLPILQSLKPGSLRAAFDACFPDDRFELP